MDLERLLDARFGSGRPTISRAEIPPTVAGMLDHRSCRSFDDREIDAEIVELVLAAALSAPSKSDLQQTTVLWITDEKRRASILGLSPGDGYGWTDGVSELLVFCADNRRLRRAASRLGRPFPNNNLDQFMNAAVDTGIVLGAAVTAAESFGLGTCPLSELRDRAGDLIALLGLPAGVVPIAGLALGWPDATGRPITQRLPYDVRVQENTYSDATFDASFETHEVERERADGRPEGEQRDVDVFGVAHPYGWAEDRTRQYATPRRHDWANHVRRQGFDLA
jgi:nitroreductase/FMN reductase [NAD(P)H]